MNVFGEVFQQEFRIQEVNQDVGKINVYYFVINGTINLM